MTITAGVAGLLPGIAAEPAALVAAAGAALYRAKQAGRNRVLISEDRAAQPARPRRVSSAA